jgi:hypothetical protein
MDDCEWSRAGHKEQANSHGLSVDLVRVGTQIDSARRAKLCMATVQPPAGLPLGQGPGSSSLQHAAGLASLSHGLNMGAFKRASVCSSAPRCSRDVMLESVMVAD